MKIAAHVLAVLFVGLPGCGFKQTQSVSLSSEKTPVFKVPSEETDPFRGKVGVVKQRQLFAGYKTCLKLEDESVSLRTKNAFQALRPQLSPEGLVKDFNSPMLTAAAQVAAEFCVDRLDFEASASEQFFFKGFQLVDGKVAQDGIKETGDALAVDESVRALAKSCWGQPAQPDEILIVRDQTLNSAVGKLMNRSTALYLCTVVLSAPKVFQY